MSKSSNESVSEQKKLDVTKWFESLRDQICISFETLENEHVGPFSEKPAGRFERTEWNRPDQAGDGGGGIISLMRGRVFEKVGVNISVVKGIFSDELKEKIKGANKNKYFWAAGISVVAHPLSPLVPAAHMNTRHIITSESWFGGGADLTPYYPDQFDTKSFHLALKNACDKYNEEYYPKFKKWCDDYFFLPHRNEPRGVGGIFYDELNTQNWDHDFAFTREVGKTFLKSYSLIVSERKNKPWTKEQRDYQLERRGRYVEFNLLHDRGTQFGLKTGGNLEAIFMSLPPTVSW
ncbi:MAG: oxygen-dependent coproporphyrinogen oxidase [Alphaproteobacteria bacterium]|nr:oxygen-dependent coproporphyrinogen oxidase [Alphaproteobacteria bacterium]